MRSAQPLTGANYKVRSYWGFATSGAYVCQFTCTRVCCLPVYMYKRVLSTSLRVQVYVVYQFTCTSVCCLPVYVYKCMLSTSLHVQACVVCQFTSTSVCCLPVYMYLCVLFYPSKCCVLPVHRGPRKTRRSWRMLFPWLPPTVTWSYLMLGHS